MAHEKLRDFFRDFTEHEIPSAVTLRLNYVKLVYHQTLDYIRNSVSDHRIWISIDKTTYVTGRFVAHLIIGILSTTRIKSFLFHAECLEKTNSSTISLTFLNALAVLWPDGVHHDRVLLFVTDAAAYMQKAASTLKVIFPRMLYVTCAAHAIHRVAEEIRSMFPNVDKLISSGKKIFLKSASRVSTFREIAPGTTLPPQPILTRWGTWLGAAVYYAKNLDSVSLVVNALDENEAASIRMAQELLEDHSLRDNLAFIEAHSGCIPSVIKKLEEGSAPLVESGPGERTAGDSWAVRRSGAPETRLHCCASSRSFRLWPARNNREHPLRRDGRRHGWRSEPIRARSIQVRSDLFY